jgi:DNA polymerase-1
MIKGLPREARDGELVGLDIEMFGMSKPHRADGTFACLSIAFENGDSFQIYDSHDIPEALQRIDKGLWTMQNALFDLRLLKRYTTVPQRYVHDTMLVEQDLFGGWYSRFNLPNLTRRWLDLVMEKETRDRFTKEYEMDPEMEEYAIKDALYTTAVARKQMDYIDKELGGDFFWYTDIDAPAIWAILDIKPVRVDRDAWMANNKVLAQTAAQMQEDIGFNVNSHKVAKAKIEAALGKRIRNTNTKQTLLPLLSKLDPDRDASKLIRAVVETRQMRKAVSSYGESWLEDVEDDGYAYPDWKITGAETGRMACASPPMHNVPVRNMPIFRTFFPASPGNVIQVADVSQQEPVFTALLSQDPVMLKEIVDGVKGYYVYEELFNVDYDTAKAIYLGLNYGMSEYGLAATVGISAEEARTGIVARDRRYRQFTIWRGEQKKAARRHYKVHSVTGRPVWVNPYEESGQWERNAYNGPIQSSAADHTKLALVHNHRLCAAHDIPFCVNNVVHDEMGQDVPKDQADLYRNIMQDSWDAASIVLAPGLPLNISVKQGETWGVK